MQVSFSSKGNFEATRAWLERIKNNTPNAVIESIAKEGEQTLASNTPKDTGQTAASWEHDIIRRGDVTEISWYNTAHPELNVNIAKLIDQGHGTGTGGYVPPKPYIKKAMDGVFNTAGNKIAKELIK